MNYKKNIVDSTYKEFYNNNKKAIIGLYKDGSREGTWKFYDSDGELAGEFKYLKGDDYYAQGSEIQPTFAD